MTTRDIKHLHADWFRHMEAPPHLARWSWFLMKWAMRLIGQPASVWDSADIGYDTASSLVMCGRLCPAVNKPQYRWIRSALVAIAKPGMNHAEDAGVQIVSQAMNLHFRGYPRRLPLQAALLARDSTVESVAAALGLSPQFVEAYADLFHNVLVRKRDWFYRRKAARSALSRPGSIYIPEKVHPDDDALIRTGLKGTLADVMLLAGRQGRVLELSIEPSITNHPHTNHPHTNHPHP